MDKLYPPYINGTIPAFYYIKGTTETKIVVPFTMNRAVAAGEVAGFALKIKTITGDVKSVETNVSKFNINGTNASVTFLSKETFIVGQFYKVQLAYINKAGIIGYYSTVGVLKCTTKPSVTIDGLQFGRPNMHRYSYTGVYSQYGGDATEKMYSCRFVLTDNNDNIITDSGEILHSINLDDSPYESHEEFLIRQDLDKAQAYYLQFSVTTTNQLTLKSQRYRLVQRQSVPPEINVSLFANLDFNNGTVKLSMVSNDDSTISGNFVISRASSIEDYEWKEIKRFDLRLVDPNEWSYIDYTIEQGANYKYAIQQYNAEGVYSTKIISNLVAADFEDMFLYDGEKQLRIRYNPKVSSFKTTVLENKTDTIGSKYPYFSRNGNVEYKEFPISGLISYLVDEDENFVSMQELGLDGYFNVNEPFGKYKTTNLVDYNIMAERLFKNKVLDWLNNGRVKLFKSPAEGNYLVRLMNVSLSPLDQVSRMLHTFSATAYEIADYTDESLIYYGLIDPTENLFVHTRWISIDIQELVQEYLETNNKSLEDAIGDTIVLTTNSVSSINIRDAMPGSYFYIDDEKIQIGTTGAYQYETSDETTSLGVVKYVIGTNNSGQLDYGYTAQAVTLFGSVQRIENIDIPARQFIGREYKDNVYIWNSTAKTFEDSSNLLDMIRDVRTTLTNLNSIKVEKRDIIYLYFNMYQSTAIENDFINGNANYNSYPLYLDRDCQQRFNWDTADPLVIYRLRFKPDERPYNTIQNYQYYVDANFDDFSKLTDICIDGNTKEKFIYDSSIFTIRINNEIIDVEDRERVSFSIGNQLNVEYIEPQYGVITELSYSIQIQTFNIELDSSMYYNLSQTRTRYLNEVESMNETRKLTHYDTTILKEYYRDYIYELNLALDKYKEESELGE